MDKITCQERVHNPPSRQNLPPSKGPLHPPPSLPPPPPTHLFRSKLSFTEINSILPLPPSLQPCHFSIFQEEIRIDKPNSLMKNANSSDLSKTVARR